MVEEFLLEFGRGERDYEFKHIKENYTKSHLDINPQSITPLGPEPKVEPWTEQDDEW